MLTTCPDVEEKTFIHSALGIHMVGQSLEIRSSLRTHVAPSLGISQSPQWSHCSFTSNYVEKSDFAKNQIPSFSYDHPLNLDIFVYCSAGVAD